jgi:hypothetical protein
MLPDEIGMDGEVSEEVCTVTALLPLVMPPIVSPATVTTKADAGIAAPEVEKVKEEVPVGWHVPLSPRTLLLSDGTDGVTAFAKKFSGYEMVNVPPMGTGVVGVKPIVTVTMGFAATLSDDLMLNETAVTCPNISPEETGSDGAVSTEVCTIIPREPLVAAPILKPLPRACQ